ncbi:MAG: hypothetical protein R3F39_00715 [Myxococcota bacterium]
MLQTPELQSRLVRSLDAVGVVGGRLRDGLVRDLQAKLVLRGARDVIEVSGAEGSGRHLVTHAAHAAAADLLGRSGARVDVDCAAPATADALRERIQLAAGEAVSGTLVLEGVDRLTADGRSMLGSVLDATDADVLVVSLHDVGSPTATRRRPATRIELKPLHQREEDIWELVDHFFATTAPEAGLEGCRGFSRQAKADIAESVRETELASVRKLQEIVRDLVFDAAALPSVPLKLTSDHVRPTLEAQWEQTAARRAQRDAALVESQFAAAFNPSLTQRLAAIHGVSPDLLERQAQILREVIDGIDDVPRSYRNIMDRADDVSRAALWLLTGAATQAEFRRFFGEVRFMRPTKSVAWAFYNRAFKRDA